MALDPVLLDVLACPNDKQPLYYLADDGWLYNPRLQLRYRVEGDIPILLPDAGEVVDGPTHEALMARIAEQGLSPTGSKSTD